MFWTVAYSQVKDCYGNWFIFQNATKIHIRDLYENGKPWIVSKIVRVSIENKGRSQFEF